LFATGEAIDDERTYYPMMIPTTSVEQLQREFERLKGLDFDFMKLYVPLPYSWVVKGVDFAHNQMGVQTAGHYLLPAVALGNDGMSHVSATARTGYAYSRSLTGWSYSDVRTLMAASGMWTTSTLLNPAIIVDSRDGGGPEIQGFAAMGARPAHRGAGRSSAVGRINQEIKC
jgi:hypothetical protein